MPSSLSSLPSAARSSSPARSSRSSWWSPWTPIPVRIRQREGLQNEAHRDREGSMILDISSDAIELSGEGRGVTIEEIHRVRTAFHVMFGVMPEIRITGAFYLDAIKPPPEGEQDDRPDEL